MVPDETSAWNLKVTCMWWVISLSLFSRVPLCCWTLIICPISQCKCFLSFFFFNTVDSLGGVYLSSNLVHFRPLLLQVFYCPPLSLSSFQDYCEVYMGTLYGPTGRSGSVHFYSWFFLYLLLKLSNFNCLNLQVHWLFLPPAQVCCSALLVNWKVSFQLLYFS